MNQFAADGGMDVPQADELLTAEACLEDAHFLAGEGPDGLPCPVGEVELVQFWTEPS